MANAIQEITTLHSVTITAGDAQLGDDSEEGDDSEVAMTFSQ
jgi:hypothetical protein